MVKLFLLFTNAFFFSNCFPQSKRESILSNHRVQVQDFDEYGSTNLNTIKSIARSLVLPLPHSTTEANQWCSFLVKGARVYAMYPSTTALYPSTVVDSSTYCQGESDIVVVEFDGDEGTMNFQWGHIVNGCRQ